MRDNPEIRYLQTLTKAARDAYDKSSLTVRTAAVAAFSALIATTTQSEQCGKEWSSTFWTGIATTSAALYAGQKIKAHFFPEKKEPKASAPAANESAKLPPTLT